MECGWGSWGIGGAYGAWSLLVDYTLARGVEALGVATGVGAPGGSW